jgi:hypothetical protein
MAQVVECLFCKHKAVSSNSSSTKKKKKKVHTKKNMVFLLGNPVYRVIAYWQFIMQFAGSFLVHTNVYFTVQGVSVSLLDIWVHSSFAAVIFLLLQTILLGVEVHVYHPSSWEAEAGGSRVWD